MQEIKSSNPGSYLKNIHVNKSQFLCIINLKTT